MKIRVVSNDEIEILKIKSKLKDQISKVVSLEEEQQKIIKNLSDAMIKTAQEKRDLVKLQEKLLENYSIAVRNPASRIDKEEIASLKRSKENLSNSLQNQQDLANTCLDLASVFKEFLKKKTEYKKMYENLVALESKWQDLAYNYMKQKNKFVEQKKLQKLEDKLKDIEGTLRRLQGQTDRKIESLMEEAKSLDRAWEYVKNAITKYGW